MAKTASSKPQIIFLTGAPLRDELDWSECQLTADTTEFRLGGKPDSSWATSSSTSSLPKWRVVRTDSLLQPVAIGDETVFLSTGDLAKDHDDAEDFLNHSFSQLEAAHLPGIESTDADSDADISTTVESFYSALSDTDIALTQARTPPDIPQRLAITDLKHIPSAAHLNSIAPQTITINILVGIIAVQPPRTVHLRRSKAQMDLIELMVGDETRAGFSITIWLMPESAGMHAALRASVTALRPGDVIMISTLALSSFKGCVYGQSLSIRSNLSTRIFPLDDQAVPLGVRQKLSNVTAWRDHFVGPRVRQARAQHDQLPPETP